MVGIWSWGWPVKLEEADSEVLCAPLGALPARFLAMPPEWSPGGGSKGGACRACSNPRVSGFCSDSPDVGTVFEEGLMARDEASGTGPAGELMDLMRRLLRLREGVCVVFENGRVVVEDWVWLRK